MVVNSPMHGMCRTHWVSRPNYLATSLKMHYALYCNSNICTTDCVGFLVILFTNLIKGIELKTRYQAEPRIQCSLLELHASNLVS